MNAPKQNVKPRYEVHKLEGTSIRRIAKPLVKVDDKGKPVLDKDGNSKLLGGFEYRNEKVDAGWMVYFPSGSSSQIWTKEEMERQGFDIPATLVNMETGDDMGAQNAESLKAHSEQKERATKSSKVHHTT